MDAASLAPAPRFMADSGKVAEHAEGGHDDAERYGEFVGKFGKE
jgi:hypothetical protein